MTIEQLLEQCGLECNPFDLKLQKPLIAHRKQDLSLFARVEGFGESVETIHNFFENYDNLAQSIHILIYGPQGCGRSSVANYITHCFCQANGFNLDNVTNIVVKVKDNHPILPIQTTLAILRKHIRRELEKYPELNDRYRGSVIQADIPSTVFDYNEIFIDSMPILVNKPPVIVLDSIRAYSQIDSSIQVFEGCPIILFSTSIEKVHEDFMTQNLHGFQVKLSELTHEHIKDFITQRWQAVSSEVNQQHPFDEQGIATAFGPTTWTFRAVVTILNEILREHLVNILDSDITKQSFNLPPIPPEKIISAAYNYYVNRGLGGRS